MKAPWLITFAALAAVSAPGQQSPLDIVKRSLALENRNFRRARDYTCQQNEVIRESDSGGRVTSTKSRAYDLLMIYGRPYRRLIQKDGKPLSTSDQQKEEERLQKVMERRRKESEDENSKERRDFEKHQAEERKFLDEIPAAYDFRLLGEEQLSGRPVWVLQAEPKPGYRARDSRARMLASIHGKLWIDKTEYQWVKIQAETTDTISFGLFLARLSRGSSFRFEQRRVNDEVWLPSHAEIGIDGRLALLKKVRGQIEITYANYRKFQTDSKVVATDALP